MVRSRNSEAWREDRGAERPDLWDADKDGTPWSHIAELERVSRQEQLSLC